MGHSRLLFFFIFAFSIQLTVIEYSMMVGFEPRTSGLESHCSINWATTTSQYNNLNTWLLGLHIFNRPFHRFSIKPTPGPWNDCVSYWNKIYGNLSNLGTGSSTSVHRSGQGCTPNSPDPSLYRQDMASLQQLRSQSRARQCREIVWRGKCHGWKRCFLASSRSRPAARRTPPARRRPSLEGRTSGAKTAKLFCSVTDDAEMFANVVYAFKWLKPKQISTTNYFGY